MSPFTVELDLYSDALATELSADQSAVSTEGAWAERHSMLARGDVGFTN